MHIWFSATMKVSSAIEPGLVARKVLGGMQGPEQVARRYRPVHVAVQQSLDLRWQRTRWTSPCPKPEDPPMPDPLRRPRRPGAVPFPERSDGRQVGQGGDGRWAGEWSADH